MYYGLKTDPRERSEQDPHGLQAFLQRLEQNLGGGPITGFTFLQDAREMLVFSRKIESATLLSQARALLYVGFQTAAKLDGEWERYSTFSSTAQSPTASAPMSPSRRSPMTG